MDVTGYIVLSMGPAQIASIVTIPLFGLSALIHKIQAVILRNQSHQDHDPESKCGFGEGYNNCPIAKAEKYENQANKSLRIFLLNLMCLVPIVGGIAAARFSKIELKTKE